MLLPLLLLLALPAHSWVSQANDWLVNAFPATSTVRNKTVASPSGPVPALELSNGLVSRTFVLSPCWATVDLQLLPTRTRMMRALAPEAMLSVDGIPVVVGGCLGSSDGHSEFFDPATTTLLPDPAGLTFQSYEVLPVVAPYAYRPRFSPVNSSWPPKGVHLVAYFTAPALFPDPNSTSFEGPLHSMQLPCDASGCLTGFPSCGGAVDGQCSWPRDSAVSQCALWPECLGVQCNPDRADCQARGSVELSGSHYDVYIRAGPTLATKNVTVALHYEVYDGVALIKKWLTVTQAAVSTPVVVSDMTIELLRAPNFAPDQITVFQIVANNPTPFSQQIVPEVSQSFPGRTEQLWFTDPDWDACCDSELHVPYSYYTFLRAGYGPDVTFGGLTGPGALVSAAQPFESIAVRLLFHDTSDWERQGIATRRMQEALTPQLMESPTYYMMTDISSTAAFQLALTQAAAAKMQMVVVGYGAAGYCGMCPGQLQNATWVAWFKAQVDFGRSLGVGVSAYTLMQHNGWGESVPPAEQVLQRDGSRGGIACFATDWHAAYRQSVLDFAAQVGLMGVETDGQYESAACADEGGDHHHNGLQGSWHAQMTATAQFNIALRAQGIYQTGADAYAWSGAAKWNHAGTYEATAHMLADVAAPERALVTVYNPSTLPSHHADTDAGYSLPSLWERLSVGRDYVYDSTTTRLHSSGMYGIGDIADAASACNPVPGRLACVDYGLASFLGQGVVPDAVASSLWQVGDPDAAALQAIFANWTTLFALHRPIISSAVSLHIVRPTSRSYEATAHMLSDASATERALVTVYNPSTQTVDDTLAVSLYYAGLAPGVQVRATRLYVSGEPGEASTHVIGSDGGAIYDILLPLSLPAYSYGLWVITVM
jgi:hypothetical protein